MPVRSALYQNAIVTLDIGIRTSQQLQRKLVITQVVVLSEMSCDGDAKRILLLQCLKLPRLKQAVNAILPTPRNFCGRLLKLRSRCFRKLNAVTTKDAHGLGNLDDIFTRLEGATHFSALDLAAGYYQIPLSERARAKTAFRLPSGELMEWTVAPFGLVNLPAASPG